MKNTIKFYRTKDEHGAFSNFARFPINMGKKVWPTSEHYFQAMKFDSIKDQEEIRKAKSPMEAARKGRDRSRKQEYSPWKQIQFIKTVWPNK